MSLQIIKGMLRRIVILLFLTIPIAPTTPTPLHAQVSSNSANDLRGENRGDSVWLWWTDQAGTHQYTMYRATSVSGPWNLLGSVDEEASRTGGPKVDETGEARRVDLCYKVEAYDLSSKLIRTYQPMCVPKYTPQKHQSGGPRVLANRASSSRFDPLLASRKDP